MCKEITAAETTPQNNNFVFEIPGTLGNYKLVVPERLPGLNEYTDANRLHPQAGAKMKARAQELVQWRVYEQLQKQRPIKKPVFLIFNWYEKDRRRDRDNVASFGRKVIQDALVETGVLYDDGWDYITGYIDRFFVDQKRPRVEVYFIEQEGAVKCRDKRKKSSHKRKR